MKIFVIHYDKLSERKVNMIKQLKENNIDAEFISNKGKDVLTNNDKMPFSNINDAEISLFLHHIECFKKIIENQDEFALILEDDAIFDNIFFETLKNYLIHLPSNWDMLFIGDGCGIHVPQDYLDKYKKCNIFRAHSTRCADSYLITQSCAKRFLEIFNNETFLCNLPIDLWYNLTISSENIKVFWAEPTIVTQGSENEKFKSALKM